MNFVKFFLAVLVVSAASSATALGGAVTFGQVAEQSGSQDFHLVDTGSGVTISGSSQISFVFSNISGTLPSALTGLISATLTLNLSSSEFDTSNNGSVSEGGFVGTFSIVLDSPVGGQTNLLSGSIGSGANLTISGKSGAASASLSGSTPPNGSVSYNSAFIQFPDMTNDALAFSLSSVSPSFADNGLGFLAPFGAAGTATFSADSPSVVTPEPISVLILAFGMSLGIAVALPGRTRLLTRR